MVSRGDDYEFLRFLELVVEGSDVLHRHEFVSFAMNEKLCRPPRPKGGQVVVGWRGDPEHEAHPSINGPDTYRDPRTKREPSRPERKVLVSFCKPAQPSAKIVLLASAVIEGSGAQTHTQEVESEHGAAYGLKRLGGPMDDIVMHRSTVPWMRMTDHDGCSR